MSDLATCRQASEANDIDTLMGTLAPGAELVSPLSGKLVFRGEKDLRLLLETVYGAMSALTWHEEIGEGNTRVVLGDGKIGPFKLADAMVLELADDGRIHRIRPYLRPWLGVTYLALTLGIKMARHPGVIMRAGRAGRRG